MSGIYALPENASAFDVVLRSIIAHPSMLRESLERQARDHRAYRASCTIEGAERGAKAQENACKLAISFLDADCTDEERAIGICGEMNSGLIALNVAAKLQCLPTHIRTQAALTLDKD